MSTANCQNNHTQPTRPTNAHASEVICAEEALRQAATLVHDVLRQLTRGELALSAAEAHEVQAQLQELFLQADAVEACVRDGLMRWQPRGKL
jgi:hypothetical protein